MPLPVSLWHVSGIQAEKLPLLSVVYTSELYRKLTDELRRHDESVEDRGTPNYSR